MSGLRVVISATFTADPLREPLEYYFHLLGWEVSLEFAPFAQVFQTLLDPAGLFAGNPGGCNIVLARAEDFPSPETAAQFLNAIASSAAHHAAHLFVRICPSADPSARLPLEQLAAAPSLTTLSEAEQERLYPVVAVHDHRTEALGAIPYTAEYFAALAAYLARALHRERKGAAKVVALDCDDTLWKGLCGEDGPRGILLDPPRRALQNFMAARRSTGTLLAIASKNNEEDVLEAFRQNPEMPLGWDSLVARRIHWESKADSLQALSHELGLGLDSFVFIDDSPKEAAEVVAALPEVATFTLPSDSGEIASFLDHLWPLDSRRHVTAEDRTRSEAYASEAERQSWAKQARSLEEFLNSLELNVEIAALDDASLPRAAQLTERTNQMNFSTRRRTESEIRAFLEEGSGYMITVRDRFGDYGQVGLLLLAQRANELVVDTFLLSCRALGRGVEHHMLQHVGAIAFERGLPAIAIDFTETPRNRPARDFLTGLSDFSPAALARLTFDASKTAPVARSERFAPRPSHSDRRADYQRIAELRSPSQILRAVRERRPLISRSFVPYRPPVTELEKRLCVLWSDLLNVSVIGVDDNFFDLGGHSLLAVQLAARLQEELSLDLPLEAVYTGTLTVAELARSIELLELGAVDDPEYASVLAEIENLTDEEAEQLLARETSRDMDPYLTPEPRP